MPPWLEVVLGICGGLNVIGLVVWIVKTIYELKATDMMLTKAVADISTNCSLRKTETSKMAESLRNDTAKIANDLRRETRDTMTKIFSTLESLQKVTTALAMKAGVKVSDYE